MIPIDMSNHIITIDVDLQKIDYTQHNGVNYRVSEKIDFIKAGENECKDLNEQREQQQGDMLGSYFEHSRYNEGIKMDEKGWYSLTPELISQHRCGSGTIVDCFTGAGGNAIQFAMRVMLFSWLVLGEVQIMLNYRPMTSNHSSLVMGISFLKLQV